MTAAPVSTAPADSAERPNIIFILVDDMRADEFEMGFGRRVPGWESAFEAEIVDKGVTFDNFFNVTPLCCPSRASYLTGQYPHNHNVWTNNGREIESGNGGILRFYEDDRDLTSIGTWMQAAGYQTALVGKYLNGYPNRQGLIAQGVTETYIPRGWDDWHGTFHHDKTTFAPIKFRYDHFRINQNGEINTYGPGAYLTDVESQIAVDYIEEAAGGPDPFFLYLSPYAPHGPNKAAPRHEGIHKNLRVKPDPYPAPACNEGEAGAFDPDVSDKPQYIQDATKLYGSCWGIGWMRKLDMTLALDEMIEAIFGKLRETGIDDNTYIFFTSDNGQLRGEHGIGGKSAPYEESVRVPLLVVGPGVPEGMAAPHLAANIDIAPTLLEIAGGSTTAGSPPIDGESLLDAMTGAVSNADWRDGVLVELLSPGASPNQQHVVPTYAGARSRTHVLIEYGTAEREFYDLVADPYQLTNFWDTAPTVLRDDHDTMLSLLFDCAGAACAAASRLPGANAPPSASFASSCTDLVCDFDASASADTDGIVASWVWDFGDGTSAQGETVSHNYAGDGPFPVTLTVTDNRGDEDVDAGSIMPLATGISHVSTILLKIRESKRNASARVEVVDGGGLRVEGATVTGTWTLNGNSHGTFVAVTNANGRAKTIFTLRPPMTGDAFEYCVDGILHPSLAYAPGANELDPPCVSGVWP